MQKYDSETLPGELGPFICHFLKGRKLVVLVFMIFAISAGFVGPFNSMLVKKIIDLLPQINETGASSIILPAFLIVLNFIIFDNFTWLGINYIRSKYVPVIINEIMLKSMNQILGKSHQFHQDHLSGRLVKQITNMADGVENIICGISSNFLRGASVLITAMIAAFFVNPIFCLILMIWFAFFASASVLMSKKFVALANAQSLSEAVVVGEMVDAVSNHSNVKIFARKIYENFRILPFLSKQKNAYSATYMYAVKMRAIQGGLIAAMIAFSTYFLLQLHAQNLVTIGDFALIFGLSMETGHIIWITMFEVDELNKSVGRCNQGLAAIAMPLVIQDKPNAQTLKCSKGQINFKNVKFHYKGTEMLFENESTEIKAGQKLGLVGHSGGGKTTFVSLILRLYDLTEGAILIDGQDISACTQDSLRENIAMIPQDPSLFSRSLMENIRYGRIDATDAEVIEAAKKAHLHDFILKLPDGYDTMVGERGAKLSGGQRQRIAIARAILRNAPILILDEATSQLDSITEILIQESIRELMQNKTTIVVAHRLSTLLHMDRILVFSNGKIIEDGSHQELLAENGFYKQLWDTQIGGFLGEGKLKMEE